MLHLLQDNYRDVNIDLNKHIHVHVCRSGDKKLQKLAEINFDEASGLFTMESGACGIT